MKLLNWGYIVNLLKSKSPLGLISRLMEKNAMVKPCYQCSKSARPEDQYCCDDCDHIHKAEVPIISPFCGRSVSED